MKYSEFENLVSYPRLNRYARACNNNKRKTRSLYRANIRLSQGFLGVISNFEIVLRNKIDAHYKSQFSNSPDWLLVASLSFGFWKFMFAGKQFKAGGNTLLRIFPKLPAGKNQKFIYHKLDKINRLRNRVAHHEPICFSNTNTISTTFAKTLFQEMVDLFSYMDIKADQLLCGTNEVLKEATYIEKIQ